MSEDQKHQLTSILECRKCNNNFDDVTSDKTPRKLTTCGHTICEKCARELMKGLVIACPFDNQLTKLGDGNINSLLKNFALIEVVKELKRIDASRPTKKHVQFDDEEPSRVILVDEDLNIENRCFENSSHEGTVYCEKCDVIFCESCFGAIHKSKVNAGHPKLPIPEKPNRLTKCTIHPTAAELVYGIPIAGILSSTIQDKDYSKSVLYSSTENRCFENSSHEATVYCEKCDAIFCESCFGTIHKSKVNAGHPKLPIPEKPNRLAKCTTHPSRTAAEFLSYRRESIGAMPSVVIEDKDYSSNVLYLTTENRCFENSSHEATVYCEKCDAIFCESCFGTIHKSKVNAGHPKLPISQKSNRLEKCTEHPSITAEFWCKDSNCVIEEKRICHSCLLAGGHKSHQYELLADQVSNNVEKLKELMKSTQETLDKYQDRVKSFDECVATFGYEHPLYLAEIEKITKQIDAKKMQVLRKLEEFTGNSQSRLREKKKQIEAYIDNSEVLLSKIESILKSKQKLYDDTKILETAETQLRISLYNSKSDFMKVFDDHSYSLTEEMELKIMEKRS